MSKELILNELRFLKDNIKIYIQLYPADLADCSPGSEMRTTISLINHISGNPSVALVILNGELEKKISALNKPLRDSEKSQFLGMFEYGGEQLEPAVNSLTMTEYKTLQIPNPFGEELTPEKNALNTVTYLYHHSGQLHNYLKMINQTVSTETLFEKSS